MRLKKRVSERLQYYKLINGLKKKLKPLLVNLEKTLPNLRRHCYRVALLSEEVAVRLMKNSEQAFFAGLLHDIGKTAMDLDLFIGRPITDEEYEIVKTHAELGAKMIGPYDQFISLIVGWHHMFCSKGYGVPLKNAINHFPEQEIKNAMNMATIVAVCDCIDSNVNRNTQWRGLENGSLLSTLDSMLREKFPDDELIITIAIESFIRLDFDREKK